MAENGPRQGVPFHKHKNEDKSLLVIEGTFEISVGDKTVAGGPGTYCSIPDARFRRVLGLIQQGPNQAI
jgi:hypothetical protein